MTLSRYTLVNPSEFNDDDATPFGNYIGPIIADHNHRRLAARMRAIVDFHRAAAIADIRLAARLVHVHPHEHESLLQDHHKSMIQLQRENDRAVLQTPPDSSSPALSATWLADLEAEHTTRVADQFDQLLSSDDIPNPIKIQTACRTQSGPSSSRSSGLFGPDDDDDNDATRERMNKMWTRQKSDDDKDAERMNKIWTENTIRQKAQPRNLPTVAVPSAWSRPSDLGGGVSASASSGSRGGGGLFGEEDDTEMSAMWTKAMTMNGSTTKNSSPPPVPASTKPTPKTAPNPKTTPAPANPKPTPAPAPPAQGKKPNKKQRQAVGKKTVVQPDPEPIPEVEPEPQPEPKSIWELGLQADIPYDSRGDHHHQPQNHPTQQDHLEDPYSLPIRLEDAAFEYGGYRTYHHQPQNRPTQQDHLEDPYNLPLSLDADLLSTMAQFASSSSSTNPNTSPYAQFTAGGAGGHTRTRSRMDSFGWEDVATPRPAPRVPGRFMDGFGSATASGTNNTLNGGSSFGAFSASRPQQPQTQKPSPPLAPGPGPVLHPGMFEKRHQTAADLMANLTGNGGAGIFPLSASSSTSSAASGFSSASAGSGISSASGLSSGSGHHHHTFFTPPQTSNTAHKRPPANPNKDPTIRAPVTWTPAHSSSSVSSASSSSSLGGGGAGGVGQAMRSFWGSTSASGGVQKEREREDLPWFPGGFRGDEDDGDGGAFGGSVGVGGGGGGMFWQPLEARRSPGSGSSIQGGGYLNGHTNGTTAKNPPSQVRSSASSNPSLAQTTTTAPAPAPPPSLQTTPKKPRPGKKPPARSKKVTVEDIPSDDDDDDAHGTNNHTNTNANGTSTSTTHPHAPAPPTPLPATHPSVLEEAGPPRSAFGSGFGAAGRGGRVRVEQPRPSVPAGMYSSIIDFEDYANANVNAGANNDGGGDAREAGGGGGAGVFEAGSGDGSTTTALDGKHVRWTPGGAGAKGTGNVSAPVQPALPVVQPASAKAAAAPVPVPAPGQTIWGMGMAKMNGAGNGGGATKGKAKVVEPSNSGGGGGGGGVGGGKSGGGGKKGRRG